MLAICPLLPIATGRRHSLWICERCIYQSFAVSHKLHGAETPTGSGYRSLEHHHVYWSFGWKSYRRSNPDSQWGIRRRWGVVWRDDFYFRHSHDGVTKTGAGWLEGQILRGRRSWNISSRGTKTTNFKLWTFMLYNIPYWAINTKCSRWLSHSPDRLRAAWTSENEVRINHASELCAGRGGTRGPSVTVDLLTGAKLQ